MATIIAATGAAGNFSTGSSWVGGVAPTAADDAQITVLTTSMTIDAGSVCRSADFTGCTGTITFGATGTLTIGDATAGLSNIALKIPSGMTFAPNAASTITFVSTSSTQQTVSINSGYTMGNITFNSSSNGNYAITSALTIGSTSTLTFTKGTLHTDGASDNSGLAHSWGLFSSTSSNVRTLTLGNSSITMTGTTTSTWTTNGSSNLTISTNTATLTFTGGGSFNPNANANYQGLSLVFTLTNATSGLAGSQTITGITNITVTGNAGSNTVCSISANYTITGTLTINGNSTSRRVGFSSTVGGTARTISAATVAITNCDITDVTGAGAGSWNFSAQNDVGDGGGNTGITFPTGTTQTWSGTSGGNWNSNAWTTRIPLLQDTVIINAAFSASQTITIDLSRIPGINFTGATGSPILSMTNGGFGMQVSGSLTFVSGMTTGGSGTTIFFVGRSTYTFTTAGLSFGQAISIAAVGGTVTLQDNLTISRNASGAFAMSNGTFVDNGKTINVTGTSSTVTISGGILTKTGTWNLGGTAAATTWSCTGGTISDTAGSIILTTASANTRTFAGGGKTWYVLTYIITASSGTLLITGSNTFNTINFYDLG